MNGVPATAVTFTPGGAGLHPAGKELETYVSGQSAIIIDYATARRREEPTSTAITESTVQWLSHTRTALGFFAIGIGSRS
jgi:hypothetical protein